MYTVSHGNMNRQVDHIDSFETLTQASLCVDNYLQTHNIKPPYLRWCQFNDQLLFIDYGSWSNYIYIQCDVGETINVAEIIGGEA